MSEGMRKRACDSREIFVRASSEGEGLKGLLSIFVLLPISFNACSRIF